MQGHKRNSGISFAKNTAAIERGNASSAAVAQSVTHMTERKKKITDRAFVANTIESAPATAEAAKRCGHFEQIDRTCRGIQAWTNCRRMADPVPTCTQSV